jgi:hypothetical protein
MTNGKNPDSAAPRKKRKAKRPPKLLAAADRRVMDPKMNMRIGSTRAGPKRLPRMATGGAKTTYGTKKIEMSKLYWFGAKLRSSKCQRV